MNTLKKVASATLPTTYGVFKIVIYRSLEDGLEHAVLIKGQNFTGPVLARIHSQCLTGESFSSLRCDCKDQLIKALTKIGKSKNGVLIYLSQEGRGIGLGNKIKAYALQEKGLDTIEANEQLGFAADPRSYRVAAQILKDLKIKQINLLTNNPDKISQLKKFGIKVKNAIPLEIAPNPIDLRYLKTKKNKMGHKLRLV
ncbi:MAG: GTP cyclohydrolase II [Candidatus Daviesbacteria bacterium]|nr:GTP cyclohydrolase II [Candidatus Daviesbacteria bacterium]